MDQVYWDILEKILVIAIGVVLPPVLVIVANEARKVSNALVVRIQGEIGVNNYNFLMSMVDEAVHAAEQLGLTDMIENEGQAKKKFALEYVQSKLDASGIDIDVNEIDAAIEAAVNKAFTNPPQLP